MIAGFFWMLVANGAALLGAHALTRRCDASNPGLLLTLFLLVRLMLVSAAVLVAGVAGFLTPMGLGLLGAAALAALLAAGEHRHLRRPSWPRVGPLLTGAAAVVALKLLIQSWLFAPHVLDTLSYHLPKVAEWVRAGRFTTEMGADSHVTLPAGFELVETWWVVFLRHDVFIEFAGLEFLGLAASATFGLARRLGLGERGGFLAALFYAMTPCLAVQAVQCMNDGPAAAVFVTAAFLVTARAPLPWIIGAAGLGLGIKATYGYMLPGLALLAFLVRREPAMAPGARRSAVLVLVLGLALGAFWYARNAVWYGNPIHPIGASGLTENEGLRRISFGPSLPRLAKNVSALVDERIYDRRTPQGSLVREIAGWGALPFACGFLALVARLRADRRLRPVALAFAASAASVLLLVTHDPWYLRFVVFFPAVLCVAAAAVADESLAFLAVAAGALAIQFIGTLLPKELPPYLYAALSKREWEERSVGGDIGELDEHQAVGYYCDERSVAYLLYGPGYRRRVAYLRPESIEGLLEAMKRADVRLLYAYFQGERGKRFLHEAMFKGRLRHLGWDLYLLQE